MNKIALLVQCGDGGTKWIPYFMNYYNKNWICDDFIDTVFLFENDVPEIVSEKKNVHIEKMGNVVWGKGMLNYLNKSKYDNFILIHEDYFLKNKQKVTIMKKLIGIVQKYNMRLLKICGDWAGYTSDKKVFVQDDKLSLRESIFLYDRENKYLLSHQPSIWSKELLLATIKPEYNPWQHEIDGNEDAKKFALFAYLKTPPMPYAECVTAGKARPGSEKFFERIEAEVNGKN